MLNLLKFGLPLSLGVGSAGLIGSNWVFKKEEPMLIDINNDEDWDKKVKELFTKVNGSNDNLKTQIAGTGEHRNSLTIASDNNNNFQRPEQARAALKVWCQKKTKNESEKVHEDELCKEKQWVGWLFKNQIK